MSSPLELVSIHLEDKKVPLSLSKISRDLKLKKSMVKAICHQLPQITKVHPSHVGSGRDQSSLYIHSTDPKWTIIKGGNE